MNKWLELLIGLILIILPVYLAWGGILPSFGVAAISVLKGGIVWGVIGLGLLFILLGISDLKE